MEAIRIEHDLLGEVEVPVGALCGAQTRRAILNFPPAGEKIIGDYPEMVDALMIIKLAPKPTCITGTSTRRGRGLLRARRERCSEANTGISIRFTTCTAAAELRRI